MAQPVFVTSSIIFADNTAPAQGVIPIGRKNQNDIIIVTGLIGNAATSTITVNPGYTSIGKVSGSNMVGQWFWKRAGASEGDPSISGSTTPLFGAAVVFSGVTQSGLPYDAFIVSKLGIETSSAIPVAYSITPTIANTLLVSFANIEDDTAWTVAPPPTGWTTRLAVSSSTGTDAQLFCITSGSAPTSGSATNNANFGTISTAEVWGTLTLNLFEQPEAPVITKLLRIFNDSFLR